MLKNVVRTPFLIHSVQPACQQRVQRTCFGEAVSIPMAAISSNDGSTLSKAATFKLTLPDAPEACPIGLAPTTSTTLALALGDALAVALMQPRNFRTENFPTFHPGGRLGAEMMRAGQLRDGPEKLPIVSAKSSMADTLLEMTSKGFGVAALMEAPQPYWHPERRGHRTL